MLELDALAPFADPVKPAVSAPPPPTSAPAGVAEVRVLDIGDFKDADYRGDGQSRRHDR
jgi:pyruvate dehydrogenase E2 component (dihydrolipoamide acetyltransferase)